MERRNTSYGGDDYEGILLRSYGKTKVTWAAMMLISQLYILLQHSRSTRCFIDEKSYYFVAMLGKIRVVWHGVYNYSSYPRQMHYYGMGSRIEEASEEQAPMLAS